MLWPYANGGAPNIGKIVSASRKFTPRAQIQSLPPVVLAEHASRRAKALTQRVLMTPRIPRGKIHSSRGGGKAYLNFEREDHDRTDLGCCRDRH
jgi:hypothetical protein